ncbi:MAG TPA: peptide-N-glycosidase F-related protein [Ignavibacteria bacterium]|nr:peptide-N-glycosidase F-related protein [Ignavibacteria bacterium]
MKIFTLVFIFIVTTSGLSFSVNGDTINIFSHKKEKVITDPQKGFNSYKNQVDFPGGNTTYRKAILKITYQCPDSQNCGEWDYIDYIYLKKNNGYNLDGELINDTSGIEIARMISPYGSRFTPDWKFEWKTDITDFAFLLHDPVEIDFIHTGYESNTDRGWLVTIKFELTEGTPVMETVGFEKLWKGVFPYGNGQDDIQNYLQPVILKNEKADFAELRILQTGHGMDDFENCAEFCSKWRQIYFDNDLYHEKQIWRECADNPLYPQAGTWIFDRAGWCPGAIVRPDIYFFSVEDKSEHEFGIEMEPYVNPNKPSANYVFSSYLFYYKKPEVKYDISLEEIISPSLADMYSRKNPNCQFPVISVRNNTEEEIKNFTAVYGSNGSISDTFEYKGNIKPFESKEVVLPGTLKGEGGSNIFKVELLYPNDEPDEYVFDNSGSSEYLMPPVFDEKIIVKLRTNKEPSHNFFQIRGQSNIIFRQKSPGYYKADTVYTDTFKLGKGCYEIVLGDTANDGLDFWFNPEGGYGYLRITDADGKLIKAFNPDFGKEIRQQFIVTGEKSVQRDSTPLLNIFPARNPGKFFCDIFLNEKSDIRIEITTGDKKKNVYKKNLKNFKEGMVNIDISGVDEGNYFVNLKAGGKVVSKKIRVKKS